MTFTVTGLPVALKRPRMTRRGIVYDPSKNEKETFAYKSIEFRPPHAFVGPLEMHILFRFQRPASHIKKDGTLRKNAPIEHIYKPDLDNLIKFVLDALSPSFFKDDKQIMSIKAKKIYTEDESNTEIMINVI